MNEYTTFDIKQSVNPRKLLSLWSDSLLNIEYLGDQEKDSMTVCLRGGLENLENFVCR